MAPSGLGPWSALRQPASQLARQQAAAGPLDAGGATALPAAAALCDTLLGGSAALIWVSAVPVLLHRYCFG